MIRDLFLRRKRRTRRDLAAAERECVDTRHGPVEFLRPRRGSGRAPLLIALHGYGSEARQMQSLLPVPERFAGHHVCVEAPIPLVDGGRAWFEFSVRRGQPAVSRPELDLALDRSSSTIEALRARFCGPQDEVVVAGYSQGATLVLELLASGRPLPFRRAAAFAGSFVSRERVTEAHTPCAVFFASGEYDPVIGGAAHHQSVRRLEAMGHRVHARRDPVPHVISAAARRAFAVWLG